MTKTQTTLEDQLTLDSGFNQLKALINETSGLVVTQNFGKKNQLYNFYIFSHKKKIEAEDLLDALIDTINFITETRVNVDGEFKMK